jgi:hypothetical protein
LVARVCVRARVTLCSDDEVDRAEMEAGGGVAIRFSGYWCLCAPLAAEFVASEREAPSIANVGGRCAAEGRERMH